MSTLRISNIEAKSVPASATIDEKVKITNSSGDTLVFIDGKTSGITTVGINTTDSNITFDANSNVVVTGIITATRFSGEITPTTLNVSGGVGVGDSIFHIGDDNTQIRFPANDTVTAETGGSERLRITNNGLKVGTTVDNNYAVIHAHSSGTAARLHLTNANTGTTTNDGAIIMIDSSSNMEILNKENTNLEFFTNNTERLRITSGGYLKLGSTDGGAWHTIRLNTTTNNAIKDVLHVHSSVDSATAAAGFGVRLNFIGEQLNGNEYIYGGIAGLLSSTGSNYGDLAFYTNNNGTNTERIRITSAGLVGIATNAPSAAFLDIASSQPTDSLRMRRLSSDSNVASNWSMKPYGGHLYFREGGSTDKIQFMNGGDLYIMDGNLRVASGHGIDFSATGNGGSSPTGISELFSDYETGTFVVTLANGLSVNVQTKLTYTKIGNKCHISGQFRIGTGGSDLAINNLPFTTVNTGSNDSTFSVGNVALYNVSMPSDGNASGEIITKTQKNDNNIYFVYNRHNNDPNSHTATANGYYTISHWYTVST